MGKEYDLFISYRRDKGAALALETQKAFHQKYNVFFDRTEITSGSFSKVISEGIEGASVVFSLLSLSSLERMLQAFESGEEGKDVVVAELEQTRTLEKPIVFTFFQEWTKEAFIDPFALLAEERYGKYPLFRWISSLHINLYNPMDDFRKQLHIVEQLMMEEREKREEEQQQRLRLTHKYPISFQETTVDYIGEHFLAGNQVVPLGKGQLYQNPSRSESRIFQGNWWGSHTFSGDGELLVTRVLKAPVKQYQGAWHELRFHHQEGWLQEQDRVYEGGFYRGKKQFFAREQGDEQTYSGIFHNDTPVYGVTTYKNPSWNQPVYEQGNYRFYENGSFLLRGKEDFSQCFVQDDKMEYRFSGKTQENDGTLTFTTLKEVAVRDLEQSDFQVILWGSFEIGGNLVGSGTFLVEDEEVSFRFSGDFLDQYEKEGRFLFPDESTLYVDHHQVVLNTGENVPKNKQNEGYLEIILRCFLAEYKLFSCLFQQMPFLTPYPQYESYQMKRAEQLRTSFTVQDLLYLRSRFDSVKNIPFLDLILEK